MEKIAYEFAEFCKKYGHKVVTAESCTAGLISSTIAMVPGSSQWLDRGFVVYTPEAKNEMLDVKFSTIDEFDITSVDVAKEMALGALKHSRANLALSVTGLAGPSGGTEVIPTGTICMAWALKGMENDVKVSKLIFLGSRNHIREQIVHTMLTNAILSFSK